MSASALLLPGVAPTAAATFAFRRDPFHSLSHLARSYGDIVRLPLGAQPHILLSHPDLVKAVLVTDSADFGKGTRHSPVLGDGLLTSEGDPHRQQRDLIQPAFHRQKLSDYACQIATPTQRLSESWTSGARLDIAATMSGLTRSIISNQLFGSDITRREADLADALATIHHSFAAGSLGLRALLPASPERRLAHAVARFDAHVRAKLRAYRRGLEMPGGLVAELLETCDAAGRGLTDDQIRDAIITLFLAGSGTTASILTWAWHALSTHPDVALALHNELDSMLGGRAPTAADVSRLAYTGAVVAETLRLYPPSWLIRRVALRDVMLGGYSIPAGATVYVSPYLTQRDPRFYPDPLRFDPSRYTPDARATRPKWAYFPFGGGAHMCIGAGMAQMTATLIIATIAQTWQMRPATARPVLPKPTITLMPRDGLPLIVARRTAQPQSLADTIAVWEAHLTPTAAA